MNFDPVRRTFVCLAELLFRSSYPQGKLGTATVAFLATQLW